MNGGRRIALALAVFVSTTSALFARGMINGDIAVYLHQASLLDFGERTVHVGYIVLASLAHAAFPASSLLILNIINALCGVYLAASAAHFARSHERLAGLILMGAMLPVLSWAEVDLFWLALLVGAARFESVALSASLWGFAILCSPVALLCAPLLVSLRPERLRQTLLVGALVTGALCVGSDGDWLFGDRGLLSSPAPRPAKVLEAWLIHSPWLLIPFVVKGLYRYLPALVGLPALFLVAPDVPTWIVPSFLIAVATGTQWESVNRRKLFLGFVLGHFVVGCGLWVRVYQRTAAEEALISHLAQSLSPDDRFVAPWSLGVRLALRVDGEPYRRAWLAHPDGVRDQGTRWCQGDSGRVAYLPAGVRPDTTSPLHVDHVGVVWGERECKSRPNVVLVIGCTVRRDQVGVYGSRFGNTPWLDSLAERGSYAENMVASAPWTKPAVAAILTGRHASSIGLTEPGAGRNDRVFPPSEASLATTLSAMGYETIGVSANPNISGRYGFDLGFDAFELLSPAWEEGVVKVPGKDVVSASLERLDRREQSGPVFLQLVFTDSHAPLGAGDLKRNYGLALRQLDSSLSVLEEQLLKRGMNATNTIWLFVGDHGEGLNEPVHHGPGHGRFLYPSTTFVPWVMKGPGIAPGGVVRGITSQLDVFPTLLGMLGEHPEATGSRYDLSEAFREGNRRSPRVSAVSATWFKNVARGAIFEQDRVCQRDFGSGTQPPERPPFYGGCFQHDGFDFGAAIEVPELLGQLESWWAQQPTVMKTTLAPADSEEDRQLEALGYIETVPDRQ